jgi:hypothetical protein
MDARFTHRLNRAFRDGLEQRDSAAHAVVTSSSRARGRCALEIGVGRPTDPGDAQLRGDALQRNAALVAVERGDPVHQGF